VGLIQRAIEAAGIPTIGISLVRKYSEKIRPPRTIFVNQPFGHPLGEPFKADQQNAVLQKAFEAFSRISEPGTIIDVTFN